MNFFTLLNLPGQYNIYCTRRIKKINGELITKLACFFKQIKVRCFIQTKQLNRFFFQYSMTLKLSIL